METVIPPDKTDGHVIQKYRFKILASDVNEDSAETCMTSNQQAVPYIFKPLQEHEESPQNSEETRGTEDPLEKEDVADVSSRDEAMEEMLKKADELSSNLVKMQMQLEKKEEEFALRLEEQKRLAYDEGIEDGKKICSEEMTSQIQTFKERLAQAIGKLEESQNQFLQKVDTIEEELIETALDLAKQVVVKEIEKDSKEVALRLAKLLLNEVKEASDVTLKVNPSDYDFLKTHLKSSANFKIVADEAIGEGGVVILSDIGNIDGEIMQRFERIKEAVFGPIK